MADLTDQTTGTPAADSLVYIVLDPAGTPLPRKAALSAVLDFIEANGAAPASFLSSGTLADARVAESNVTQHEAALTITESQISDLGTYLENLSEDTTPQLGGNLDVNGNSIASTSNGNITIAPNGTGNIVLGNYTLNADATVGAGQDNYVLKYDHSTGLWGPEEDSGAAGGDAWSDAVDADIVPDGDGTRDLGATATRFAQGYVDEMHVTNGIILTEAADHPITPGAGLAQLWVSNDATQVLYFTDDGGTDNEVSHSGNSTPYTTSGNTTVLASVSGSFTSGDLVVADANGNLVDGPTPPSGSIVGNTDTQTLTNKTLTAPVLGGTVTGTYTIGGTPTFPGILGDLDTLGAPTADGEFIVATGAGAFAYETGATARTSMGAAALGANEFTGTQDFNGQQVEAFLNKVVGTVSGTLTTTAHSGNVLETSGNVTVPTTAGFNCVLIAGGAHTVTFNGNTSAAMATGDIMTIIVEDSTTIHAVLTAAADKVSFS